MKTIYGRLCMSILFFVVMVLASHVSISNVYAGECFTGDVFLKDYEVSIKSAVYLRSGPCSDDRTTRGEVLSAGEEVTVLASNHGWLKVRRDNGAIGWIRGKWRVEYNVTQDRFPDNQYVSKQGYDTSDTHEEFSYVVYSDAQGLDTANSQAPTSDKQEWQAASQEFQTSLSADMQTQISNMLDTFYTKLADRPIQTQKDILMWIRGQLTILQDQKPHLQELIEFMTYKINQRIQSL